MDNHCVDCNELIDAGYLCEDCHANLDGLDLEGQLDKLFKLDKKRVK
jgi:hypothetical protein